MFLNLFIFKQKFPAAYFSKGFQPPPRPVPCMRVKDTGGTCTQVSETQVNDKTGGRYKWNTGEKTHRWKMLVKLALAIKFVLHPDIIMKKIKLN